MTWGSSKQKAAQRENMKKALAVRHPPMTDADYLAKLKAATKLNETGCWMWQQFVHKPPRNYGEVSYRCKKWRVHRLMWFLHNGEIPKGMVVMHTCDNPPCCNPDHLKLGTYLENMSDCRAKDRYYYANLDKCKHGHPFTAENTYYFGANNQLRACKVCHRIRHRMRRLGWTREQAESLPPTPPGRRPVNRNRMSTV